MSRPPAFTIENITRWINTRELPEGISMRCCLDEMRYLLIVNQRLKEELAKQIPGEMNYDIQLRLGNPDGI